MAKNSEYELAIKIAGKVDSSLKSAIKSAKGELGSLSTTAKNAFKGIAVAGAAITAAAIAVGKSLYDLGAEFDNAYDTIRIGTGATGEALEDLKGIMKDVYSSVPTDMESAAIAISDYNTRLGLTGDALETLSKQALQVSNMLGDDLGGVIEASSQSFQIFDLDANQMADSMDWLFKVSQSTGIGFTELTSLVQSNGAAFQQMGFSYNESAAMLGKLEKAGYKTSTVMTAMTYAVKASAKMGLEGRDAYEKYYNSILNAKDETEAIRLSMELFGSRSGTVMAQAIRDGTLAMSDFTRELEASEETINGAAEDTYDLAEKWQMFTNRMKVALEPMATTLFDSVGEVVESLLPAVEALMPVITGGIAAILPAIEELVPVIVDFGKQFASDIVPVLADLIANVLPIVTKLLESLLPVVMEFVSTILPPVISLIEKLLPPLMQIVDAILPVVTSLIEALSPILLALMTALQPVFDILTQILPPITSIISKLSPIITLIGQLVVQIIDALSPAIAVISDIISSVLNAAFETIGPVISGVMDVFGGLIDFISNVFAGNWSGAWQAIVDVFGGIWDTIKSLFKAPINAVISMLNWFIGKLNSISIGPLPNWSILGQYAGAEIGFDIPEIAYLAEGGVVTEPTMSMVGEGNEPEAVLPLSKLASMLEQMGGNSVTNNDSNTTQSESIVFSPVFNFYGDTSKEQAEEAGRISFAEFKRMYQQMKSEERRKSFSMA